MKIPGFTPGISTPYFLVKSDSSSNSFKNSLYEIKVLDFIAIDFQMFGRTHFEFRKILA